MGAGFDFAAAGKPIVNEALRAITPPGYTHVGGDSSQNLLTRMENDKHEQQATRVLAQAAQGDKSKYRSWYQNGARLFGATPSPEHAETFADVVARLSPHFQRFAPHIWNDMHGTAGAQTGLASGILNAHKYDSLSDAAMLGKVQDVQKALPTPEARQGLDAGQLGEIYQAAQQHGLGRDMATVGPAMSAMLEANPNGNIADMVREYANSKTRAPDFAQETRANTYENRFGGSFAQAQRDSGLASKGVPMEQAQQQNAYLMQQNSDLTNLAGATARLAQYASGFPQGSPAAKFWQAMQGGEIQTKDPAAWMQIMVASGIPQGDALAALTAKQSNALAVTPGLRRAVRYSQGRLNIFPHMPKGGDLRGEGLRDTAAKRMGYESYANVLQHHDPEVISSMRQIDRDAADYARRAGEVAHIGKGSMGARFADLFASGRPIGVKDLLMAGGNYVPVGAVKAGAAELPETVTDARNAVHSIFDTVTVKLAAVSATIVALRAAGRLAEEPEKLASVKELLYGDTRGNSVTERSLVQPVGTTKSADQAVAPGVANCSHATRLGIFGWQSASRRHEGLGGNTERKSATAEKASQVSQDTGGAGSVGTPASSQRAYADVGAKREVLSGNHAVTAADQRGAGSAAVKVAGELAPGLKGEELSLAKRKNPRSFHPGMISTARSMGSLAMLKKKLQKQAAVRTATNITMPWEKADVHALDKPEKPESPRKRLADGALQRLLLAKQRSDEENYAEKYYLVRQVIMEDPKAWMIDSDWDKKYPGLTHLPTGFRIHMPHAAIPSVVKQAALPRKKKKPGWLNPLGTAIGLGAAAFPATSLAQDLFGRYPNLYEKIQTAPLLQLGDLSKQLRPGDFAVELAEEPSLIDDGKPNSAFINGAGGWISGTAAPHAGLVRDNPAPTVEDSTPQVLEGGWGLRRSDFGKWLQTQPQYRHFNELNLPWRYGAFADTLPDRVLSAWADAPSVGAAWDNLMNTSDMIKARREYQQAVDTGQTPRAPTNQIHRTMQEAWGNKYPVLITRSPNAQMLFDNADTRPKLTAYIDQVYRAHEHNPYSTASAIGSGLRHLFIPRGVASMGQVPRDVETGKPMIGQYLPPACSNDYCVRPAALAAEGLGENLGVAAEHALPADVATALGTQTVGLYLPKHLTREDVTQWLEQSKQRRIAAGTIAALAAAGGGYWLGKKLYEWIYPDKQPPKRKPRELPT